MQSLQNLFEYLVDSEQQMENDKVEYEKVVNSKDASHVPVAAGAGDTNICGGIIQLYWNSILGRCLDANEQVRQSALKVTILFHFFFRYISSSIIANMQQIK